MKWKNRSDFWDQYEFKDVVDAIWKNYAVKAEEQRLLLNQIDDSKSILTVPYKIKLLWKKLKWSIRDAKFNEPVILGSANKTLECISTFGDNVFLGVSELLHGTEEDYIETPFDVKVKAPTNKIELARKDGAPINWLDIAPYVKNDTIEFWAPEYFIHNDLILTRFAPIVGLDKPTIYELDEYSELFYYMIKALWFLLVNGPSLFNIKVGLYIFFNLPIPLRKNGTVEIAERGNVRVSYEDGYHEEWHFNEQTPITCKVGDKVERFQFLVDGPELSDYINDPGWWEKYHYDLGWDGIERHSKMFTAIPEEIFQAGVKRDMTVLAQFLNKVVPEYVNHALALISVWDNEKADFLKDLKDFEWDEINLQTSIGFEEKWPKINGEHKVNGSLKADNLGDSLKIQVLENSSVISEPWRIY